MSKKQKLELTWIGKDVRPKLEPRILLEKPELSFHAEVRVSENDIFDNILIHGDNLLALKALEQEYAGKVKCIYIDPPYNTGSAFEHYDDGVEHSLWLSLMRDRIEILRRLLTDDGSLWMSCDDNEAHYLKVTCDEIFGRKCFVTTAIWQKVDSPNDNKVPITPDHEYVICFTKTPEFRGFHQRIDNTILDAYRQPDAESDIPYRDRLLKKNGKNSLRSDRPSMFFKIDAPDGTEIFPIHDDGREACWAMGQKGVDKLIAEGKLIWKKRKASDGEKWVPYTREFAPHVPTKPYQTIWNDLDTSRQTKSHQKLIFGQNSVFATPKPENLIQRIFRICTNPGDLVLDSFLGSGTTAAVAQKMGRRWIGIELGEHCYTHCIPRLQKVIKGEDLGGITFTAKNKAKVTLCKNCQNALCEDCQEKVGKNSQPEQIWFGGGGFRFYELGPSLIREDAWGNPVINQDFNPEMLAEALCKLENFTYAPSPETFWIHGQSSETDFIYVTTQFLTQDMLTHIAAELGEKRSLLICCAAHSVNAGAFPNITIKKIPKAVLEKCEWGKDDYSLAVENLPQATPAQTAPVQAAPAPAKTSKKSASTGQASLLDFTKGEQE